MRPSHSRSGVSLLIALVTALSACTPLSPRKLIGKGGDDTSNVSVAFDPSTLGELAQSMKTLQVRIYKVENDVTGAQEGDAQRFAIESQRREYTISDVQLGLKDIEVAILDTQDLALGTGKVRVLVKPGKNKTEPLVIKLTQIVQPIVTLPIEIKVDGAGAAQVQAAAIEWQTATTAMRTVSLSAASTGGLTANYETDIKPIMEAECVSCHREGNAKRKLKLDRWPFVSGNIADSAQLLAVVMERIQNAEDPMPQAGLMDSALIDKMKDWQAADFLASAPTGGQMLFRGAIADLKVSEALSCTLVLTAVDGIELLRKDLGGHVVQESGVLTHSLTLDLEAPSVDIPIVVEQ